MWGMIFHYVPGKIISQEPESSKRGGNLGKNWNQHLVLQLCLFPFGNLVDFPAILDSWLCATSVFDLCIGHPHPTNLLHPTSSLAQIQHFHVAISRCLNVKKIIWKHAWKYGHFMANYLFGSFSEKNGLPKDCWWCINLIEAIYDMQGLNTSMSTHSLQALHVANVARLLRSRISL